MYIRLIVLAYYLGGLKSDEEEEGPWEADEEKEAIIYVDHLNRPWEAYARALKYPSWHAYFEAGFIKKDISEIHERHNDAYRRLFANVGLDFDDASPGALFDAVVTMVNQLPDHWLNWLRSIYENAVAMLRSRLDPIFRVGSQAIISLYSGGDKFA